MEQIFCVLDVALPLDLLLKISCSLRKQGTIFLNEGSPEPCLVQGRSLHRSLCPEEKEALPCSLL
jgi:hypothetical protein